MKRVSCRKCRDKLLNRDIALNLKLRGRAAGTFFCLRCLAEQVDSTKEELIRIGEYFQTNGCELFAFQYVDEAGGEGS